MTHYVIDTNVTVVANGRDGDYDANCRLACIEQLEKVTTHARHRVVLDKGGDILAEYRRHLSPSGQPGVGDFFYRYLINNCGNPKRIYLVEPPTDDATGEFQDILNAPALQTFDGDDKKFVAAALNGNAFILNAVDSDYREHSAALSEAGVRVKELCPQCVQG